MVIVIMGVSGSGKTVVGEALAARLGWAFEDADDWHPAANVEKMHSGMALTDEDRLPWIRSLSSAIGEWVADKRDVALACSALRKWHRNALREGVPSKFIRFVYLKGTYEEIDRRLRSRVGHFMPDSLLKSQFQALEEPGPSEALVVDVGQPVSAMVDSIISGLHLEPKVLQGRVLLCPAVFEKWSLKSGNDTLSGSDGEARLKTTISPQNVDKEPISRPRTVVGLGEALWDMLPAGRHIGGAPLNFAYISSLLGEHAVIASRIGSDGVAEELLHDLSLRGVDAGYIQRDKILPTGTVAVRVSADGQPAYEIHQPSAWDALEWSPEWQELARRADAVCFGTLAQRSEPSRITINTFLETTRPDCVRIFDVNLRPPFFSHDLIVDSMRLATIVKLNEEEFVEIGAMVGLSGHNLTDDLRTFAATFNLELVCVTRGGHGSVLATPEQTVEHSGFPVTVVDTVGAGDAFTAAVARCWISHLGLDETSAIANRWAGWVASQPGAMPVIDESLRRQMLP